MNLSMNSMLIFGMGYTAQVLAERLRGSGWLVRGTGSAGDIAFNDGGAVREALGAATHVLSSVPPLRVGGGDPVLETYGADIARSGVEWIGYLSSTGVYGDARGAWVDEGSVVGQGRRSAGVPPSRNLWTGAQRARPGG